MANYHFIAIGGAVMHQLALHLKAEGNEVSGSDDIIFEPAMTNLKHAGILPTSFGWYPEKINHNIDAVILGMHAKADNPELIKAEELGLKIYSFPEFFYQQCKEKTRIAIAGSHGKTSITSMIMHIFKNYDKRFDYLVGAKLDGFKYMVSTSKDNDYAIIEADEYLTSPLDLRSKFLHYFPQIAIISGIAWDHINVFPTFDNYLETFRKFIASIQPDGYLIYNQEDEELRNLVQSVDTKHIQLIPYSPFDAVIENEAVKIKYEGQSFPIEVFGKHNLSNLKAAFEVGKLANIDAKDILNSFQTFKGAAKRLECIYQDNINKITIYRDFAHAPSKVNATVQAVREKYSNRKMIAFFELHTYSSLQENFICQYAHTLDVADVQFIYIDAEALKIKNKENFDPNWLKEQFANDKIIVLKDKADIIQHLKKAITQNCVVLLMSSGNIANIQIEEILHS
ncbi:MAG TPA: Mur ligase family protein [Chitinophagales bacterium]|nr:Mur ligase family protein [Chitinophagales bacterium]